MYWKYKVLCYTYLNLHLVSFIVTKQSQDNPWTLCKALPFSKFYQWLKVWCKCTEFPGKNEDLFFCTALMGRHNVCLSWYQVRWIDKWNLPGTWFTKPLKGSQAKHKEWFQAFLFRWNNEYSGFSISKSWILDAARETRKILQCYTT